MNGFRDDRIPLAKQYAALMLNCNGTTKIMDNDRTILWEGTIKPMPLSRTYDVVIKYTLGFSPKCVVTSPILQEMAGERKIPHTYRDDEHIKGTVLCLFFPRIKKGNKVNEWQPNKSIANTIIPWASLWLTYFEEWLYSDNWQGGGAHPTPDDEILEDNTWKH